LIDLMRSGVYVISEQGVRKMFVLAMSMHPPEFTHVYDGGRMPVPYQVGAGRYTIEAEVIGESASDEDLREIVGWLEKMVEDK